MGDVVTLMTVETAPRIDCGGQGGTAQPGGGNETESFSRGGKLRELGVKHWVLLRISAMMDG